MMIVNTIPMPEKMAPATKYGGKIVVCHPGSSAIAKSNDTTECTDSTSGVENAARNRYVRAKCRHSLSEFRQPNDMTRENPLAHRIRRAVAQHRDVRNEPDVEERGRDGEVRRDGEHVPHQRALEVRPDEPPVRVRNQPEELPRPADVNDREESGRHDGEHRHRFGASVNRGAEAGAEEIQNGRDQRARVADTDPEDEADDVDAPHHRRVVTGVAEAPVDLVGPRAGAPEEQRDRDGERAEPAGGRRESAADVAIDLLVIATPGSC